MKQTIILLLALVALASCSQSENEDIQSGSNVPVTLSAGMPTAIIRPDSRAVIETGNQFTAGVAGWETTGQVNYSSRRTWYTTAEIEASPSEKPVTLKEPQVYRADNAIKTHMKAWCPAGEPTTEGKVAFPNTDGSVDALLAGGVVGSKNDHTGKVLQFKHKTTQLKFKVVAEASLEPGTTLKEITVLGAELPTGFDLAADALTYAAAGALTVSGITDQEITGTATEAGQPVMIKPMTGNKVHLKIRTSAATFDDVVATIDNDGNFLEGKAYTITLTFRQQAVGLTATVDEWISGSGSAEIE